MDELERVASSLKPPTEGADDAWLDRLDKVICHLEDLERAARADGSFELERAVARLRTPPEGQEADWLGRLDKVIRRLGDLKRSVMAELPGPVEGDSYKITEARSAKRSFNTAAILAGFAEAGWGLSDLLAADACRLTWRWSDLKHAAVTANVGLRIAHEEVDDQGDVEAPMVGEVWKQSYRIEGAK